MTDVLKANPADWDTIAEHINADGNALFNYSTDGTNLFRISFNRDFTTNDSSRHPDDMIVSVLGFSSSMLSAKQFKNYTPQNIEALLGVSAESAKGFAQLFRALGERLDV